MKKIIYLLIAILIVSAISYGQVTLQRFRDSTDHIVPFPSYWWGPMNIDGLTTLKAKINADYTEAATAADPTRYWDFRVDVNAVQTASSDYLATLYGRINWAFGDNSNVVMSGVEGVASSASADESVTLQGGYFRTYISPGSTATARSSFGVNISARAAYAGTTAVAAETGTAFVGARIYMAPYFASATNINNFHGLWIFNEHPTIDVTNGIFISSATSGASYTNFLNCVNATGTTMFNVGKLGDVTVTSYVAGVDSFLTTATADTIVISGVATTNVFVITGKTFNYSTTLDTVTYSYRLNTDTLFVTRIKTPISGGAVKSGGQYSYVRMKK